jgi:CheY-like chemotaxis protein
VLVVEDELKLREIYRRHLTAAGFKVVAVEDGVDALRHLETNRPDAILLDLSLPQLDGWDLHREIKTHPGLADVPIVVVTGTNLDDLAAEDFAALLTKPVDIERVIEAVDQAIRRTRS